MVRLQECRFANRPRRNGSSSSSSATKQKAPTSKTVASQWSALDNYAVNKGYYAAYGHEEFPKFYSDRLNFNAGVMSVEYQTDMTSLQLK